MNVPVSGPQLDIDSIEARAGIEPYYADDLVTLYHGDCRHVLPAVQPDSVALLLTDPPYGIGYVGGTGQTVTGDDEPFDPRPLLRFGRCVIWGADNFAHLLPPSRGWIVWSKIQRQSMIDGRSRMSAAPVEMAWSNVATNPELFNHFWAGGLIYRASERGERYHPTQKPAALMQWIVDRWTVAGDLVLDPYMGSGPVAQACKALGRKYIGIEIEERYCEIAARRLDQCVLDFTATPQPEPRCEHGESEEHTFFAPRSELGEWCLGPYVPTFAAGDRRAQEATK